MPGEWYGINSITNIFEALNEKYRPVPDFKVCVFNEGHIICDVLDNIGRAKSELEAKMGNNYF